MSFLQSSLVIRDEQELIRKSRGKSARVDFIGDDYNPVFDKHAAKIAMKVLPPLIFI